MNYKSVLNKRPLGVESRLRVFVEGTRNAVWELHPLNRRTLGSSRDKKFPWI